MKVNINNLKDHIGDDNYNDLINFFVKEVLFIDRNNNDYRPNYIDFLKQINIIEDDETTNSSTIKRFNINDNGTEESQN